MSSFKLIFSFLILGTLVSCDTKRNPYFQGDTPIEGQSVDEMESQFAIINARVDVQSLELQKPSPTRAPEKRKLFLTACLNNIAGAPIPQGLLFEIVAGNERKTARTGLDSCIRWQEVHGVSPIASEVNLRLKRTVVSKNQYAGRRTVLLYWNLQNNQFQNNIFNNFVPEVVEDPIQDSFEISDATSTVQQRNRVQPSITTTPESEPENFVQPSSRTGRLVLTQIALERIKLDQERPFKVDQNLTLYAQHTYQVSANPRYFVYSLDNPEREVNLPGGQYKVTLVFLDDPQVDILKLIREINQLKSIESVNQPQTPESRRIKIAGELLMSEKTMTPNETLKLSKKRQLLNKILLGLVNTTVQFTAEHTPEQDIQEFINIQIRELHRLDVRSLIAVTIENVTAPSVNFKGHGVGYIRGLLNPGFMTPLMQTPIEADQLHELYQAELEKNSKLKPLDMFMKASVGQDGFANIVTMDESSLSADLFPQSLYKEGYPFASELENYLAGKLEKEIYRKSLFGRSLCQKVFLQESLKELDRPANGWLSRMFPQNRLAWAFRCQSEIGRHLSIKVLDFVESVQDQKVYKVGRSFAETITVSQSFSRAISEASSIGRKYNAGATATANINLGIGLQEVLNFLSPAAGGMLQAATKATGAAPIEGSVRLTAGGSWFATYTNEKTSTWKESVERNATQQTVLNVNVDTFGIQLPTRRCLVVTLNKWILKVMLDDEKIRLPGNMIVCSNQIRKQDYQEKYYVVSQQCNENNGTTDCASDEETRLRTIIRGQELYESFAKTIEDKGTDVVLKPISSENLLRERMQWTTLMDAVKTSQFFPGTLFAPPPAVETK